MECRLCKFLIFIFFVLFSTVSYADCGDEEYVNWMGEMIEEAKLQLGGVALLIPTSLALGQAIQETGYGTSYSAKKRNNHFGLSLNRRLLKFTSVKESVRFYLETLQERSYYRVFRKILLKGETNSYHLLKFIAPVYAEDVKYQKNVSNIIKSCNLKRFDDYT